MLYIGTAGYYYDDWIGPVYPAGVRKKDFLRLYAQEFSFTEINSSFYRLPNPHMFNRMQEKTPAGFRFVVKAYRGFTHERENRNQREFKDALRPLIEAGKLGCVLAQFPYSFRYSAAHAAYVRFLKEQFEDVPLAVEFRHASWVKDEVFAFLRECNLAYVIVDLPRLAGLPPPVATVTADIAYVRFHGRNARKWWHHTHAYERYDYLYSENELKSWVPAIRQVNAKAQETFVSFNNHYQGKAVVNARMLARLLQNG